MIWWLALSLSRGGLPGLAVSHDTKCILRNYMQDCYMLISDTGWSVEHIWLYSYMKKGKYIQIYMQDSYMLTGSIWYWKISGTHLAAQLHEDRKIYTNIYAGQLHVDRKIYINIYAGLLHVDIWYWKISGTYLAGQLHVDSLNIRDWMIYETHPSPFYTILESIFVLIRVKTCMSYDARVVFELNCTSSH